MSATQSGLLRGARRRAAVAVVLGSGLGAFADELTDSVAIPYAEIPGWPQSTAVGHSADSLLAGFAGRLTSR